MLAIIVTLAIVVGIAALGCSIYAAVPKIARHFAHADVRARINAPFEEALVRHRSYLSSSDKE